MARHYCITHCARFCNRQQMFVLCSSVLGVSLLRLFADETQLGDGIHVSTELALGLALRFDGRQ